ncbi:TDP-N-acetylfucosamine:lipid II N-acetylfucosaminyltransferase [bacterium]|nr:TDP-N-acetylfucosamine:lipid II N-acetylfucosaminyltransferase [bacterium]
MTIKYLHLLGDSIFADFVIDEFEMCAPGENFFLVGVQTSNCQVEHIRNYDRVVPCYKGRLPDRKLMRNLKAVFLHSMSSCSLSIIRYIEPDTRVFWFTWGYDFYPYCKRKDELYFPETYRFWQQNKSNQKRSIKSQIGDCYRFLNKRILGRKDCRELAIRRVDYCSTVVPTEYPIVETLPGFKAEQVSFNYGSLESLVGNIHKKFEIGDSILVGNSNTMTSNHVDAFQRIAEIDISKRKIIVPLSYGIGQDYKNYVIDKGKYYFGNRFFPVLDFMPIKEYVKLLASCDSVVFNHTRQQGLGTLLILTWLGASIYLNPVNPIYEHFKAIGINVYNFSNAKKLGNSEPVKVQDQTRRSLSKEYGDAIVRSRVTNLIEILNN